MTNYSAISDISKDHFNRRQFFENAAQKTEKLSPREIPRGKRECIYRHYSKVLALILNELEVPDACREFIEAVIIAADFPENVNDWLPLYDAKLAGSIAIGQANCERAIHRLRKQRAKLEDWQSQSENPIIIEMKLSDFDPQNKQRTYLYRLPICELIRSVIEKAPVNCKQSKIELQVRSLAGTFLREQNKKIKALRPKRQNSTESDIKRGFTLLEQAYERELQSRGEDQAQSLLRKLLAEAKNDENHQSLFAILQIFQDLSPYPPGNFLTPPESQIAYRDSFKNISNPEEGPALSQSSINEEEEDHRGGDLIAGFEEIPLAEEAPMDEPLPPAEDKPGPPSLISMIEGLSGDHWEATRAFLSVGLEPDQILFKDDLSGKIKKEAKVGAATFIENLCANLGEAKAEGLSFIARMRGDFIQVDDCDQRTIEALEPFAFLGFETSPQNYQAWLALAELGGSNCDAVRDRFFKGLKAAGLTGNGGAYGALRWPGSLNFKPNRRGESGPPRVRIIFTNPGRKADWRELEAAELLPVTPPPKERTFQKYSGSQSWPDYEKCLRAKATRSEADAQFTWIALKRGFSQEMIKEKLGEISERAEQSGSKYIERTIREVAKWANL